MALVTLKDILPEARKQKRAVAAFNVANYECALGVIRAVENEKLPVIIQMFQRMFRSEKGCDLAASLVRMAHRCSQPVVIQLDHGAEAWQIRDALSAGMSSVLLDGSTLPYDENVQLTSYAADYAHRVGASCEGEIGHVAMGDDNALTTVEDAVRFFNDTKVDALAISVGTVHGFYKAAPCIDVKRCRDIADALPETPLVLHGGSGTPPEDVRALIENGITKINIATEFMDTFLKSTKKQFDILEGKFRAVDLFNDPVVDDCAAYASKMLRFFAGK